VDIDAFFEPWEGTSVESFDDFNERLNRLYKRWVETDKRRFAWRGVTNASWPLHSSLYRRLAWTTGSIPDETDLLNAETETLKRVHQWGLHNGGRGRLSILSQLATLQHFDAPTRLIDVTLNAYIGLWFAVQQELTSGIPEEQVVDGRLFAIDITKRLINEKSPPDVANRRDADRDWEDERHRPWKDPDADWQKIWCSHTWAWRPPPFEARIAAQNGAFLFGGVPSTGMGVRWPKDSSATAKNWKQEEVRSAVSIPLRFHKADPLAGGVPTAHGQPAYIFRIKGDAKPEIRDRLRALFGYEHSTIYPDFPGFATYAGPHLARLPPPDA
jgi:hypothetical protein